MNCWSKLEFMCMNVEEALDLRFLGHSCLSEFLTDFSCQIFGMHYRGELLSLTIVAMCWGLLGHRTKDISKKTHKSTFRADYKAMFLSMMTAACLFLFQEKLLHLPEQWTSLGLCATSDSSPLPSFITSQSAPKCQPWAVCTTPRGHLWELV